MRAITAAALAAAWAQPGPSAAEVTITLDETQTHQAMSGWECTAWIADPCTPHYDTLRDLVLDRAVNDVGIDRVRLEVRSGVENDVDHYRNWVDAGCPAPPDPLYYVWRHNRYATVDDNGDPDAIDWSGFHFTELDETIEQVVLPMRALVNARGETLHVNLCYVAFTGQIEGGSYHHDDPAEYAEFVLATYLHMQAMYDFVPDTWEVVLEPDNVVQWNGTLLGQAIAAAGSRLQAAGFTPRFVAPSNATMSRILVYFDDLVAVPGAADHLTMFSYHRYGADDATLRQIVDRALLAWGLETGMLEWWFDNATYEVLHKDVTLGRNSAWQGSVLRGLFEVDDGDPENITIENTVNTMYERQYFRFVRAGAVRIEATSDDELLAPVAFVGADGTRVVVVKAARGAAISIAGLPAGTYGVKYTTGGAESPPLEYDVDLDDITIAEGEALCTAIPDLGLITVHGRASCPADLDGSGAVDFGDLLAVLAAWGPCEGCPEDLDDSGAVDFADLLVILGRWGPCT